MYYAGSFYLHYPRHRTLISINKRNTGGWKREGEGERGGGGRGRERWEGERERIKVSSPYFLPLLQEAPIRSLVSVTTGTLLSVMMKLYS